MCGCDTVDEDAIRPWGACCCCYNGCYLPLGISCLGAEGKCDVCCLECDVCFKIKAPLCPFCCCGPRMAANCTLLKLEGQFFCCVQACAFPCDKEVPCMVNAVGLTI
jgi:hypothetical protein